MVQDLFVECVFESSNFKPVIYSFTFTQTYMRKTITLGEQEAFFKWRSSERVLIWCSCGTEAEIFELSRVTAD